MKRSLLLFPAMMLVATLAACASPAAPVPPSANSAASGARPNDFGNIRWNKATLHLTYPARGFKDVVLTYWAANGYFTYPVACQNGDTVKMRVGKTRGNPNRYYRVTYSFRATSKAKDTCSFSAVLNNTGSPPITTLAIDINS